MSNQLSCNIESHPSKLDFALQNSSVGDELSEKSYAMLLILVVSTFKPCSIC
jgi:hypothetical protein